MMSRYVAAVLPALAGLAFARTKAPERSPIDEMLQKATQSVSDQARSSPGSLYSTGGQLSDGFRDLRAGRLYDLVTVVVSDHASAVSSGATKTARKSAAKASITALGGAIKAARPLANLANATGDQQLDGQGTTSRATSLSTTLTAQVVAVLPNGNLVLQAQKELAVNSERQVITVRGIVRPDDVSPSNSVSSDRLAILEVRINGKGVVGDAVKRPFFLYRILLGLLPF